MYSVLVAFHKFDHIQYFVVVEAMDLFLMSFLRVVMLLMDQLLVLFFFELFVLNVISIYSRNMVVQDFCLESLVAVIDWMHFELVLIDFVLVTKVQELLIEVNLLIVNLPKLLRLDVYGWSDLNSCLIISRNLRSKLNRKI